MILSLLNISLIGLSAGLISLSVYLWRRNQKLSHANMIMDTFIDSLKETGVVAINKKFECTFWNESASYLTGRSKTNSPYEKWPSEYGVYYSENDPSPVNESELPLVRAISGEKVENLELYLSPGESHKGKHVNCHAYPIRKNNQIIGALAYLTDIEKDKNKIKDNQKAIYNTRMTSISKIAGGVAHDINTPLSTIMLCSESIESKLKKNKPEEILYYLGMIKKSADKIHETTQSLRKYAQQEKDKSQYREVNLVEVIDESLKVCELELKICDIPLITKKYVHSAIAITQPALLTEVIYNLINNAREAIDSVETKWIKITLNEVNSFLEILVTDSGQGIDLVTERKMYEPFYSTKTDNHGSTTGIGLGVVKDHLRLLGGEITFLRDELNTTFKIKIPLIVENIYEVA